MNKPEWNSASREALDRQNVSFHEAGHCIAAKHFGLKYHAHIVRIGNPTMESKAYDGQTLYQNTTKFREAVIAWSGLIAESLANKPVNEWPNEDIELFEDCIWPDELSGTDRDGLNAHPQRRRALKTAWRIVIGRRNEVVTLAEDLSSRAPDPRKAMEKPPDVTAS